MTAIDDRIAAARRIKKTYNRITTALGIAIGIVLSIYFFTFAMIIDRLPGSLLIFQAVTAVIMIIMLFFLKRIGLAGARLRFGQAAPYGDVFAALSTRDFDLDDDALVQRIRGQA